MLAPLPPVKRNQAMWWLTELRVLLHDEAQSGTAIRGAVARLDRVLNWLQLKVAQSLPDAAALSGLTGRSRVPGPGAAGGAHPPVPTGSDDEPVKFLDRLPGRDGQAEAFAQRVRSALEADIAEWDRDYAQTQTAEIHDAPGRLYPMDHITAIAELAGTRLMTRSAICCPRRCRTPY